MWSSFGPDFGPDFGHNFGPDFGPNFGPFGPRWDTKRLSCGIVQLYPRCLVKLNNAERSLSANPKPGFDDLTVLLELEVFDVRVGGQKLAVREVNYP